MEKKKANWLKVLLIAGLAVVLTSLVAGVGYYFYQKNQVKQGAKNRDIIATINGQDITTKDLNEKIYRMDFSGTVESPRQTTEEERKTIVGELIEDRINELEAPALGITVTEKEIDDDVKNSALNISHYSTTQKEYVRKASRAKILKQKVEGKFIGEPSGKYLLFRFDKYIGHDPAEIPGQNDKTLIKTQKDQAKKLADDVYQKLVAKTITMEQAITLVNSDPIIGTEAFKQIHPNMNGAYEPNDVQNGISYFDETQYANFKDGLKDAKANVPSKPYLLSGKLEGGDKEIAYVILLPTNVPNAPYTNRTDYINDKMKAYKGVVYFKNANINLPEKRFTFFNLIQEANAACPKAYSGSELTRLTPYAYYVAADGLYRAYVNVPILIHAGGTSSPGLHRYSYSTCAYVDSIYQTTAVTNWSGSVNFGQLYRDPWFAQSKLIDCAHTSVAGVHYDDPSGTSWKIPNTVDGTGYWRYINSGFNAYGIVAQPYDSAWSNGATGNWTRNLQINLMLETSNSWANGTAITKRAVFVPTYVPTPDPDPDPNPTPDPNPDPNPAALSCTATPGTGLAPLVVKVSVTGGTPNYRYVMNDSGADAITLSNRGANIYFTYSTAGNKKITVTDAGAPMQTKSCDVVIVKDPTTGTGGEVAP